MGRKYKLIITTKNGNSDTYYGLSLSDLMMHLQAEKHNSEEIVQITINYFKNI